MTDAAWPRIESDPGLAALYGAVLIELDRLGPYDVRYAKAAVQVLRPDGAGVLAVHPDTIGLAVTLVLDTVVTSPRMLTAQQLSPGVWTQRLRLTAVAEVDDELRTWLSAAYRRRPVTLPARGTPPPD